MGFIWYGLLNIPEETHAPHYSIIFVSTSKNDCLCGLDSNNTSHVKFDTELGSATCSLINPQN